MSLLTDIKSVSDSAIEQLSGRFHDLPRPLLAAIGAGDMAVERLAALREQLTGATSGGGAPTGDDVKAFAADLPGRAQRIAGDVAHHLEQLASSAPERVQQLIGELPAKASELTDSLSPENVRGTVEAYTQFVAMIYGNLAERGEKTVQTGNRRASGTSATGASARTPRKPVRSKAEPKAAPRTEPKTEPKAGSAVGAKTAASSTSARSKAAAARTSKAASPRPSKRTATKPASGKTPGTDS